VHQISPATSLPARPTGDRSAVLTDSMSEFVRNKIWCNPRVDIHAATASDDSIVISHGSRHFRLEGFAKELLLALDCQPADVTVVAGKVCSDVTEESLRALRSAVARLQQRGIVYSETPVRLDGTVDKVDETTSRPIDFVWRQQVIPAYFVRTLARPLSKLLRPQLMALMMPLMIAYQCFFVETHSQLLHLGHILRGIEPRTITELVVANYVALLLHELGHAAGCISACVENGAIGVCVYLIFPGLYTDVSNSWRVPGTRRLIVDLGGIYLSLGVATVGSLMYVSLGSTLGGILAILADLTILCNLNPIARMDGYWVLSDIMRLPHLMAVNRAVTVVILRSAFRGERLQFPPIVTRSQPIIVIYTLYYVSFILTIGAASTVVMLRAGPFLWRSYIPLVFRSAHSVVETGLTWHAFSALWQVALASIVILSLCILVYRAFVLAKSIVTEVNAR
jgi:hypothetical protein